MIAVRHEHEQEKAKRELEAALVQCQNRAKKWQNQQAFDPDAAKVSALRQQAMLAQEASIATSQAEALAEELGELKLGLEERAEVRLGALLAKRRIKPGAVVTTWSKSRGKHAGELSRKEFREAVAHLIVSASGPSSILPASINAVRPPFWHGIVHADLAHVSFGHGEA
jgi:hypothetical protein